MPGKYCSVEGCHHQETREQCRYFRLTSNLKKRENQIAAWIRAVNRKNPDGSDWQPSVSAVICGCHFVGGEFSRDPTDPAYIPTIFPNIKPKSATDVDLEWHHQNSM